MWLQTSSIDENYNTVIGVVIKVIVIRYHQIERIYILCLITIIKSEVWAHCLWLGHETMVCAVCLSVFLSAKRYDVCYGCCIYHWATSLPAKALLVTSVHMYFLYHAPTYCRTVYQREVEVDDNERNQRFPDHFRTKLSLGDLHASAVCDKHIHYPELECPSNHYYYY